jgi:DNA-binding HxlR family transcriptional regulator
MAHAKNSWRSTCPIARTLDLVGDRWTLLVLRDLYGGKSRFDEFLASPEGIATNILSERLARLEREKLIVRSPDAEDGRRGIYSLTDSGKSLLPVLGTMRDWGLAHIPGADLTHFVAMQKSYVPAATRPTRTISKK